MSDDLIAVTLDYNGWHPIVTAERMAPLDWQLAVHQDPWLHDRADAPWWCVSDILTGRLIAVQARRGEAIESARAKLEAMAERRGSTVTALLSHLRQGQLQH